MSDEVIEVKVEDEKELEKAKELLAKEKEARESACLAEVLEVLEKHGCFLAARSVITSK